VANALPAGVFVDGDGKLSFAGQDFGYAYLFPGVNGHCLELVWKRVEAILTCLSIHFEVNVLQGIPHDPHTGVTSPDIFISFFKTSVASKILMLVVMGNKANWDDTIKCPILCIHSFFASMRPYLMDLTPESYAFLLVDATNDAVQDLFRTDAQDFDFAIVSDFCASSNWTSVKTLTYIFGGHMLNVTSYKS
jgi:hypothetical protein